MVLKRNILWWMLVWLLFINTLVTVSVDIAIVAMVNSEQLSPKETDKNSICPASGLFYETQKNDSMIKRTIKTNDRYSWSEYDQHLILSSYFSFTWITIFLGSLITHRVGPKFVTGISQCMASVISSLIVLFAPSGPKIVATLRSIQGVFSFVAVPVAVFTIMGNWSPPDERGKFLSCLTIGSSAGLSVGSYVFGYIAEYIHWKYVFYCTSLSGILWSILWFYLVYDNPVVHPSITQTEREHILKCLENPSHANRRAVPWKSIACCIPFIASTLCINGVMWQFTMLTTYTPKFLRYTFGLNVNDIGLISSVPQVIGTVLAFAVGVLTDYITKKRWLSITNCRKLNSFIGCMLSSIPLLIITFAGCNLYLVLVCLLTAAILRSFCPFGAHLSIIDLAPNFSGILEAIAETFTAVLTMICSSLISYSSLYYEPEDMWKIVFIVTSAISTITSAAYILMGTSEKQPWNSNSSTNNLQASVQLLKM